MAPKRSNGPTRPLKSKEYLVDDWAALEESDPCEAKIDSPVEAMNFNDGTKPVGFNNIKLKNVSASKAQPNNPKPKSK
ncbi:hypothetical protein M5689_022425 [Euphorbia peplus]|nr:hypothetical protein M5689_022425 [Euphorbia peplus]